MHNSLSQVSHLAIVPVLMLLNGLGGCVDATETKAPPQVTIDRSTNTRLTLNEVSGGEFLFRTDEAGQYEPAIQLGTEVDIRVRGMVASVEVKQRFKNPASDWAHAVYAFPLPETAAVNAMQIDVGDRVIVGEIREKEAARKEFEAAKVAGKKAALMEQRRANLFTSSVANIPPGEEILVTLNYLQKVEFSHGRFSMRFPTTITPRYMPGSALLPSEGVAVTSAEGWATATDEVPDAQFISPFLEPNLATSARPMSPLSVHADIDPGLPLAEISSAYHDIHVERNSGRYTVELVGDVFADRDFELVWKPTQSQAPQAAMFMEEKGGDAYAMLMVVPPQLESTAGPIPREVVFVVDRSGSMSGVSLTQAKAAVTNAIGQLRPIDTFNIIQFDDNAQALFDDAQPAIAPRLSEARGFVNRMDAGGGTEMQGALMMALDPSYQVSPNVLRQVIFITDGSVGNEEAMFQLIGSRLGSSRLFTVGIGSAPNSYFMRKAAEFGRGSFTYIGNINEVEHKVTELFASIAQPALRDIELQWPGPAEAYPFPVHDLYRGQPLLITAKLKDMRGTLQVKGRGPAVDWEQSLNIAAYSRGQSHNEGIAALWARDKIEHLEDELIVSGDEAAAKAGILELALNHQLMSQYTSFIAVEKVTSRPTGDDPKTKNVANLRPNGQGPQAFAYPQTATTGPMSLLLGFIALLLSAALWQLRRRHFVWGGL
jgi:Ca-activated chloride channel family protein